MDNISCPFCSKVMKYDSTQKDFYDKGSDYFLKLTLSCNDCKFKFEGLLDDIEFSSEEEFYSFVKNIVRMKI